jgi:CO/xanthine dehydrogenase Mo-binding subunit
MSRVDAVKKASGISRYVADFSLPNMAYAAAARSTMSHARITKIDTSFAETCPGVIGIFTAKDLSPIPYGRSIVDTPILARDKVRFIGERVAAVVATSRLAAEYAAAMIEIDYEPLTPVYSAREALAEGAPAIHDEPWSYRGSKVKEGDPINLIYRGVHGDLVAIDEALARSVHQIDHTYFTQSVHQGYLEPQACIADFESPECVRVWLTNKAPYRVREMVGSCLEIDPKNIELQPITLGGDFGGKGSPQDAPLCTALSRETGRPVKMVLRYSEDLTAANPRHPAEIRVRIGTDAEGHIEVAAMSAYLNAGAYGSFTPNATGPHGAVEIPSYRVPLFYSETNRVYTNTVPRGNMRAPGAPQGIFAIESAMDELALVVGIDPVELRRRNLLVAGEADASHEIWVEHRSTETIDAALAGVDPIAPPEGWLYGCGVALYSRPTTSLSNTSIRITPVDDGCVRVETPLVETGTGSHTALRQMLSDQLGLATGKIEIVGIGTGDLPREAGAGGSRVTAGLAAVVDVAAKQWMNRLGNDAIVAEVNEDSGIHVGSYIVQIAQVAVDPETGQLKILELLNAIDVASIINPLAHQMQIDGGAAMGIGYATLEDLDEADGQVWAANMGEYKLPSARDVPSFKTIRVPGGIGLGTANVKNIGESTTPPVAAAVANAVYDATKCRIRELPITAEKIYEALKGQQ